MSTRPSSSMSCTPNQNIMTSSTHSAVNMRSRPSARKPRPVSVHVTGISSNSSTAATTPTTTEEKKIKEGLHPRKIFDDSKRKLDLDRLSTPRQRTSVSQEKEVSPTGKAAEKKEQVMTTSTIRRASSKGKQPITPKSEEKKEISSDKSIETLATPKESKAKAVVKPTTRASQEKESRNDKSPSKPAFVPADEPPQTNLESSGELSQIVSSNKEEKAKEEEKQKEENQSEKPLDSSSVVTDESSRSSPEETDTEINVEVVKSNGIVPEPQDIQVITDKGVTVEAKEASDGSEQINGDTAQTVEGVDQTSNEDATAEMKPKITTEEQAKAALAEKRRLAREAQEREAARLEELRRQEEERQRKEHEEQERLLEEVRKAEEERLQRAIRERELREEEERKRKAEEEAARIEKEQQEREAAREAERIRLEMEERLRREEEERVERRKRVEAIMSRTRLANRKNQDNQQENLKNT